MKRSARWVGALMLAAAGATAHAADYSFDLSEIEARPFEWSGFVEAKVEHFALRPGSALYPLNYGTGPARRTLDRASGSFELAGQYRHDTLTAYGRINGVAAHDALASSDTGSILEAGLRISPRTGLSFDLGKQVQRWGKGYAWNPVGFFERPKDPNDPTASRQGFVMASTDFVASPGGWLQTVGLTMVALPVNADLNRDYGALRDLNVGGKLYLLAADTDIDLLWAAEGTRPQRVGLDFSRNLGSNLELHGEWARAIGATRRVLQPGGGVTSERGELDSWLLGLRYITEREVTWIAELYRQGTGYHHDQLATFYRLAQVAFGPGGTPAQQGLVRNLASSGYGRAQAGQRYVYLRASAKDPFDWLYVTPALTAIVNLDDHGAQLTPELVYTGWQNVELRARLAFLRGGALDEFGEKPASRRFEFSARLYF